MARRQPTPASHPKTERARTQAATAGSHSQGRSLRREFARNIWGNGAQRGDLWVVQIETEAGEGDGAGRRPTKKKVGNHPPARCRNPVRQKTIFIRFISNTLNTTIMSQESIELLKTT